MRRCLLYFVFFYSRVVASYGSRILAIALVLVYVGAVMVLFMFVVMMLDINIEETKKGFGKIYCLR